MSSALTASVLQQRYVHVSENRTAMSYGTLTMTLSMASVLSSRILFQCWRPVFDKARARGCGERETSSTAVVSDTMNNSEPSVHPDLCVRAPVPGLANKALIRSVVQYSFDFGRALAYPQVKGKGSEGYSVSGHHLKFANVGALATHYQQILHRR